MYNNTWACIEVALLLGIVHVVKLACSSGSSTERGAGLLQGSRSSVARCRQLRSEALGSIPTGYPSIFSLYCDLPPVAYHPFLPPVVVNQNSY